MESFLSKHYHESKKTDTEYDEPNDDSLIWWPI